MFTSFGYILNPIEIRVKLFSFAERKMFMCFLCFVKSLYGDLPADFFFRFFFGVSFKSANFTFVDLDRVFGTNEFLILKRGLIDLTGCMVLLIHFLLNLALVILFKMILARILLNLFLIFLRCYFSFCLFLKMHPRHIPLSFARTFNWCSVNFLFN